jgi:hypothetical protein
MDGGGRSHAGGGVPARGMWVPGISGWGRWPHNNSAGRDLGPWAVSGTGPNGSLQDFTFFDFLSFSLFLISYLFQTFCKSGSN